MKDLMKEFYGSGPNIKPFQSVRKSKRTIADAVNPPQTMTKDMPHTPVDALYGDTDRIVVSDRVDDLWRPAEHLSKAMPKWPWGVQKTGIATPSEARHIEKLDRGSGGQTLKWPHPTNISPTESGKMSSGQKTAQNQMKAAGAKMGLPMPPAPAISKSQDQLTPSLVDLWKGDEPKEEQSASQEPERLYTPRTVHFLIDRLHVGTPDHEVESHIRSRTKNWPEDQANLAVKDALERHRGNQQEYQDVMRPNYRS